MKNLKILDKKIFLFFSLSFALKDKIFKSYDSTSDPFKCSR